MVTQSGSIAYDKTVQCLCTDILNVGTFSKMDGEEQIRLTFPTPLPPGAHQNTPL
jgi:hypothetical protein